MSVGMVVVMHDPDKDVSAAGLETVYSMTVDGDGYRLLIGKQQRCQF